DALIVLLLTPELYAPLRAVAAQFHASADGLAAADRILDLIDDRPPPPAAATPPARWECVRFEDVRFRYPGRDADVLDGFDLPIPRGEIVALVGPSGCGKSTVASMLLGFSSPDHGEVTLDGASLSRMDLRAWREQVAWLPQRPTLFTGSVRDNIALGATGATDRAIRDAAAAAAADELIEDLPGGYDTRLGEGGRTLSSGERRRI